MKISDEVKLRFNEKFRIRSTPWLRGGDKKFIEKFSRLVLKINDVPRLLDLGCGNGWISVYFKSKGIYVDGIDSSPIAIRQARSIKETGSGSMHFKIGDALHLPYKKDLFDAVFDRGMFHHQPEYAWEKYIKNVGKVLKPEGLLYLSCYSDTSIKPGLFPRKDGRLGYRYKDKETGYWSYDHYFNDKLIQSLFCRHFSLVDHGMEKRRAPSGSRLLYFVFKKK